jgi:hypothetical protein
MVEMNRRALLGAGLAIGAAGVAGCSRTGTAKSTSSGGSGAPYSLDFDAKAYKTLTTTVTTADGEKQITYRFWTPIPYVANPINTDYQSLIVSVPVEIDGKTVDASNAPILLANSVGGYFPASVKGASEVGGAKMEMGGMNGAERPQGGPSSGPDGVGAPGGDANAMVGAGGQQVSLQKLALAAGYVVVEPGVRGRTLTDSAGKYFGTAPAAIVDLKAAVRYIRHHKGKLPGNVDHIISTGVSAGGALSSLLGASGDSPLYDPYLKELGAADASDAIFAVGAWCPITDLEHADMAYEWNWGALKPQSGKLDSDVSAELKEKFPAYQKSLNLQGLGGFGPLTADAYSDYLLTFYLQPSATRYLAALPAAKRKTYLSDNSWITWSGGKATFTYAEYLAHVATRKKLAPAFDAFDLSAGENNEFGLDTTKARHFTLYSLREASGSRSKELDADLPEKINLMNPMYFLGKKNAGRSTYWWIRLGTKDTDTSLTVSGNLAAAAAGLGDEVSHLMYWDAGHGANQDPDDFIRWIAKITA